MSAVIAVIKAQQIFTVDRPKKESKEQQKKSRKVMEVDFSNGLVSQATEQNA